ncbi:MAG: homoserine kinase, partial [Oscillospiraceae bacterium]
MYKIKVPATSANLGSGFDSLGLALNMYNYVEMDFCDTLKIESADEIKIPTDESNLIYKTVKYLFDVEGKKLDGLYIRQTNNIPMARGLGSSSACIVAGLVGANALLGNVFSKDEIVDFAAKLEGHPDNSTPAILGGVVTAVIDDEKVYHIKHDLKDDLQFTAIIPDFELETKVARSVIPMEIPHKDAVFNLSRCALMAMSLSEGPYENIKIACKDKLHQPYRLNLIKNADDIFKSAYENGAYGAFI